jgi:hypothetical protein
MEGRTLDAQEEIEKQQKELFEYVERQLDALPSIDYITETPIDHSSLDKNTYKPPTQQELQALQDSLEGNPEIILENNYNKTNNELQELQNGLEDSIIVPKKKKKKKKIPNLLDE